MYFNIIPTLLIIVVLASCNDEVLNEMQEPFPEEIYDPIKYLALGDSYTIGESVAPSERYPVQLVNRLINDGVEAVNPQMIARTGWRTDDLISAIESSSITDTFDIVSLLIGVNNQYQGSPIDQYKVEFAHLLEKAIRYAGGDKNRVFVLSIPDYGFTPFGSYNQERISFEIDVYNAINKSITEAAGISWFNVTPISRMGLDSPELIASDGLHPSGEMYRQWVDLIYEEVKSKVE